MSREPEIETRERIFRHSARLSSPRSGGEEGEALTSPVLPPRGGKEKKGGTGETGLNKSRLLLATDPVAIWRASRAAKKEKDRREERERERIKKRKEERKMRGKIRARDGPPIILKLISGRTDPPCGSSA